MFRFANSFFLYFLGLIPLLIIIYLLMLYWQRKSMKEFTDSIFFDVLMPLRSPFRRNIRFILFLVAITSLIMTLARPQFGSKLEEVKREGIELIIALDISKSMLAEDIKPNRLERAKQAITSVVNRMQDDKIGMIVFAGDAYTQLPITTDYISAKIFLQNINTDMISKQGTAIASAIDLGTKSFSQDTEASKVIVVISDGENHEGDALEAARNASEKGIQLFAIGMGSKKGAPVPLKRGRTSGFLKDRKGEVVISRMDPVMLEEIAKAGGGQLYEASGLNRLYNELEKLDKAEIESKVYTEYDDQFHYFLALALIFIILEMIISERKSKYFKNFSFFGTK